jgi:hypothetical protein
MKSYAIFGILALMLLSSCEWGIIRNCRVRTDSYYGYSKTSRRGGNTGAPVRK